MKREINWLVRLVRNILRILCVFIVFHWILFTSYANCTNYYESISKAENHKEEVEYGKNNQKTIEEIEEDILNQIEEKKNLTSGKLLRKWKKEILNELSNLEAEIERLKKRENLSENERKDLTSKQEKYKEELKEGKKKTIENIQDELRSNDLNISELDDRRNLWKKIWYDPLKFFFISPLNWINKNLGIFLNESLNLQETFLLEIVFKLLVVKLFFAFFVSYSEEEASAFSKGWERMQDPSLSTEEKEKIQQEISPLMWRGFFNLLTIALNFFFIFHPCFVNRSDSRYLEASSWAKWALPMIGVSFLFSISHEFLRQGRILRFKEIKEHLAKSWLGVVVSGLVLNIVFPYSLGIRNTYGLQLIFFCGGLIDFFINIIKVLVSKKSEVGEPS